MKLTATFEDNSKVIHPDVKKLFELLKADLKDIQKMYASKFPQVVIIVNISSK